MLKNLISALGLTATLLLAACTGPTTNPEKTAGTDSVNAAAGDRTDPSTEDFSASVSGHFILEGASCAGFNFTSRDRALWTNEIACDDPDTLALRWLDTKSFITKSTRRINENCPPRVDFFKVVSYDKKRLVLESVWTGWNEAKDETLVLNKVAEK